MIVSLYNLCTHPPRRSVQPENITESFQAAHFPVFRLRQDPEYRLNKLWDACRLYILLLNASAQAQITA